MESRASDVDSDSVDSLYADLTSPDTTSAQNGTVENAHGLLGTNSAVADDDDSEFDISMSADSDAEDDVRARPLSSPITTAPSVQLPGLSQPGTVVDVSKKRKFEITEADFAISNGSLQDMTKRRRPVNVVNDSLDPAESACTDKSLLPAEIWHHILSFCLPKTLGLMLRVNKAFNAYLDPLIPAQPSRSSPESAVSLLSPETIWKASKKLLDLPVIPGPLSGKTELSMWQLSYGLTCQICGRKRPTTPIAPMDQWHAGPGDHGVSPVWPFGIRACGVCLQSHSTKEIDLLLSSVIPSPLTAALPFVLMTNELHIISPAALQTGQQPPHMQITKWFSNDHIEGIKQEFDDVKTLGTATAEEWLKGLAGRGKERQNDATRWERFEATGGIEKIWASQDRNIRKSESSRSNSVQNLDGASATPSTIPGRTDYPVPNLQQLQHLAAVLKIKQPQNQPLPTQNILANLPPRFDSPAHIGPAPLQSRSLTQVKHERTKEEVAELKAARRLEIERRCLLLDPPITAGVLAHMVSFQAAIQIIQPLTDNAWEVLKPRLLSQHDEAEQRENDRIAQLRVVQERYDQLRNQNTQMNADSKALEDSHWDDLQGPLRSRIGGYADEIIRDGWNGGEKVSADNAPMFAAEVLVYVRKRFYAEIAKDEAAIRATGREPEKDPPDGPYTRKLILENMKWLFETKIKPHTEPFRKELFTCSACEYTNKYYGFEGVVQHYAAKHTNSLSLGSVVVHWKAEWPEEPPFHPEPNSSSLDVLHQVPPLNNTVYNGVGGSSQPSHGYGVYHSAPISGPTYAQPLPNAYQETQGTYYGHTNASEQYPSLHAGPYANPPNYPETIQVIPPQRCLTVESPGYNGYGNPSHSILHTGYFSHYPATAPATYSAAYPAVTSDTATQNSTYGPVVTQYGPPSHNPLHMYQANNHQQLPHRTEEYLSRLQHVARNSRNTWNSIGHLKEIPGSLKVFTVLYHLLKSYSTAFNDTPALSMIVDGLSNNKDMRPVRNVNGLLCRACSLAMAGSDPNLPKKHFSFPQLVNHFYTVHEQGVPRDFDGHLPDWTRDMVDLPEASKLTSVVNAPGMDDKKLAIFTEALPQIRSSRKPSMDIYQETPYQPHHPSHIQVQLTSSKDDHLIYHGLNVDEERPSEASSITYESGEYDPRHPGDLSVSSGLAHPQTKRKQSSGDLVQRNGTGPSQYPQHFKTSDTRRYMDSSQSYAKQPLRPSPPDHLGSFRHPKQAPVFGDQDVRHTEQEVIDFRAQQDHASGHSHGRSAASGSGATNLQAHLSNHEAGPGYVTYAQASPSRREQDVAMMQQNRVHDVVTQITQQAQKAHHYRNQNMTFERRARGNSEDENIRGGNTPRVIVKRETPQDESDAAEHFLNNFRPGEPYESVTHREAFTKPQFVERDSSVRYVYQAPTSSQHSLDKREDNAPISSSGQRSIHPREEIHLDGYRMQEGIYTKQAPIYAGETLQRERSPELVDRRYKLNNTVYLDDRPSNQGTRYTPTRYARYESVRLDNERARSRSPVYVKVGPSTAQYSERYHEDHHQPVYLTRSPPTTSEDIKYERLPQREYHRAQDSGPMDSKHEEAYELVRVSDPRGDYMIRRPVRREPIYAAYEEENYPRHQFYEAQPQSTRQAPTVFEDEYDPRHPEPPSRPAREVRYH